MDSFGSAIAEDMALTITFVVHRFNRGILATYFTHSINPAVLISECDSLRLDHASSGPRRRQLRNKTLSRGRSANENKAADFLF